VDDRDDAASGGPPLERQARPSGLDVSGRPWVPQRVPETRPTPLRGVFIYLSVVVLICGVVAIMALELGSPMSSPVVKVPVLVGGLLLLAVTSDALVRVWRSAFAWLAVDRARGWARFVWAGVLGGSLVATVAVMWLVLRA
jgi:hypothetical protein